MTHKYKSQQVAYVFNSTYTFEFDDPKTYDETIKSENKNE